MKIKVNENELNASTTRALELVVRYNALIKDMRGFVGSQEEETDNRYLIDKVRDKASEGIVDEAAKAMKQEASRKR